MKTIQLGLLGQRFFADFQVLPVIPDNTNLVKETKSGELLFPPEVAYGEEGLEHINAPPSTMGYPPTNKSLEVFTFLMS